MVHKISRGVVGLVYVIGTLITFILLIIVLLKINIVPFPDAMLPMELYELAFNWLAIGALPMLITTILFCKYYRGLNQTHKKKKIILESIPAIICCVPFFYWIYALTIGSVIYYLTS